MKPSQHSAQKNSSCTVSTAPFFLQPVSKTTPSFQTTGYSNICSITSQVQTTYSLPTATQQNCYFNNTTNSQLYSQSQLNQTSFNQTNYKTAPSIIYLKPVKTGLNSTSSANKTIQLMSVLPQNRKSMNMVQTTFCPADSSSAPNEEIVLAELKVPVVKTGYPLPNQTIQSTYLPKAGYQLPNQTIQLVNLPKIVYQLPSQTIHSGYLPLGGYPLPNQTIQTGYLPNQPIYNGAQFVKQSTDVTPVKTDLPVASIGNSISSTAKPYYVGTKLMASELDQVTTVKGKVVVLDNNSSLKGIVFIY